MIIYFPIYNTCLKELNKLQNVSNDFAKTFTDSILIEKLKSVMFNMVYNFSKETSINITKQVLDIFDKKTHYLV